MNIKIFHNVAANVHDNKKSWLATVIYAEGFTPAKIGMKMLVNFDGSIEGTVGGGAIEKMVIDKSVQNKPTTPERWCFDLDANKLNPDTKYESTGMVCGGVVEMLIEPLFNGIELYILGGGHCGKALTELAVQCGFAVTIIDDRPGVAVPELHPHAHKVICCPYAEIEDHIAFSDEIYVVVMTHGHKYDKLVVEHVLPHPYKYLGVIGSKNKVKVMFNKLQEAGFERDKLEKVFSPIGFAIGSQTPLEVAISIMAQLMAVKAGKSEIAFNSNVLLK